MPPLSCDTRSITTLLYEFDQSGWWSAFSASSATIDINPNASTKLWNSISRCSLPSTTVQPSGVDAAIAVRLRDDFDGCSHRRKTCERGDVVVVHADAAIADEHADELGMVRAVN